MASSGVLPCFSPAVLPGWPQNTSLPSVAKQASHANVPARIVSPAGPLESPKVESPCSPPPPSESPRPRSECSSPLRKKRTRRKRCGACEGCLRKNNCGTCSVCTNPNSTNSICKHRRCEALMKRRATLSRNLFSSLILDGPSSAAVSPLSPYPLSGFPSFPQESPTTPVKDPPRPPARRRRQTSSYQPYKTPIKDPPPCGCPGSDEGFYYTHLGAAESPEALRTMLEARFSVTGHQLKMVEVVFTGIEAKTAEGCPTAEWVIRRESKEELFLVIYRHHKGHVCDKIYTVVSIVLWEGISQERTRLVYNHLISTLPRYGQPTGRRCATNESKTCSCQGSDINNSGASYSFGCSWSVYYNGCKFAKSKVPRKFKLNDETQEPALEELLQSLASDLAPVYEWLAPESYKNQIATQAAGQECRLGTGEGRPFSGITCCMDFCAHSHYDRQNMVNGGATVVCTILKKGILGEEYSDDSEQLHVLPLYRLKDPPKESVPGIEVRPVETDIRPSPASSRVPTPAPAASTPLSLAMGITVKSEVEDSPRPPSGQPQPSQEWQASLQSSFGGEDGKATPPMAALSRDLSSSMSSLNETPPRPMPFPQSEDSMSSPPSVPAQGSAQNPCPLAWPNGFHSNGMNGFTKNAAIHNLLAQCTKLEGGRLVRNGHLVNGLSPHLFPDVPTDSDSDYCPKQESPQQAPAGLLPSSRPSTPLATINGVQVKRESSQVDPSQLHPLTPALYLKPPPLTPLNGFNHQLERSVSLEKPQEAPTAIGQRPPSTPPYFRPPSIQNRLFSGSLREEEEEEEEEMEIKPNGRIHAIPGGVAMALDHGSILIECAKKELHATTPIKNPSRSMPTRISMVFYQHKTMIRRHHGWYEEEEKQRKRQEEARNKAAREEEEAQRQQGALMQLHPPLLASRLPSQLFPYSSALSSLREDSWTEDSQSEIDLDDLDDIFDPFMYSDDTPPVAIGRVPKPIPLSQLEAPFYLELPLKKVDTQKQPAPLRPVCYPSPFVSIPSLPTHTLHYSFCKPSNVYSGHWTQETTRAGPNQIEA